MKINVALLLGTCSALLASCRQSSPVAAPMLASESRQIGEMALQGNGPWETVVTLDRPTYAQDVSVSLGACAFIVEQVSVNTDNQWQFRFQSRSAMADLREDDLPMQQVKVRFADDQQCLKGSADRIAKINRTVSPWRRVELFSVPDQTVVTKRYVAKSGERWRVLGGNECSKATVKIRNERDELLQQLPTDQYESMAALRVFILPAGARSVELTAHVEPCRAWDPKDKDSTPPSWSFDVHVSKTEATAAR
jgi:hypothetical protein